MQEQGSWLPAIRGYVVFVAIAHLVWEFLQLPLYTLWWEGTRGEIIFAAVHCTGGDILIASASILGALFIVATPRWPRERFAAVAVTTLFTGLAYTIFSEWLNTEIRGSWAYTKHMPVVPLIGAGFTPVAQWILIPAGAFWWMHRAVESAMTGERKR